MIFFLSLQSLGTASLCPSSIARSDYYLLHPPKQPKTEIARYVQSHGFLIPHIEEENGGSYLFNGDREVAIRSDHPSEYAGAAGLLETYIINARQFLSRGQKHSAKDPFYAILKEFELNADHERFQEKLGQLSWERVKQYSQLMAKDPMEFMKEIRFSYWEYIKGSNRIVVADSAIPDRFHIFTRPSGIHRREENYVLFEKGEIKKSLQPLDSQSAIEDYHSLVNLYQKIRQLDRFDPHHCPVMEFQTSGADHYFLQYHRSRDFSAANFVIDRKPEAGEYEAEYVRGVTPKEGLIVEVHFQNKMFSDLSYQIGAYEASYEISYDFVYREVMSRKLKVLFLSPGQVPIFKIDSNHLLVSELFNPELTVVLDFQKIFPRESAANQTVLVRKVRIISDGKRALVKPLD